MAKRPLTAFDVELSAEERRTLAGELCQEIEDALTARQAMIADGGLIDLYDWFYEQGRSRPEDRPFPGAADLTSFIFTENIDAMRARLMKAIAVEPFCIVDGWGQDASKAPFVEAFHDWQVEEEGLLDVLGKVVHGGLIEDCYVLEVRERVETRKVKETLDVALELDPVTGGPVFDATTKRPRVAIDPETGDYRLAGDDEPSARIERLITRTKRLGPEYDAISMKDFVFLPAHAKSMQQVYGYAYRCWERVPEIAERVEDGIYDAEAVSELSGQSERADASTPSNVEVQQTRTGPAAENELYQLSIKRDFDGDGREEWYIATLSLKARTLLRLKLDTFATKVGKPRCVPFVLFPRRNSVYGYAYAGDKLLTLAEEHTALRNAAADKNALATNAPMTVLQGSAWDPDEQPFGIGRTITVRSHDEIKPLQIGDVPQSIVWLMRDVMAAKERVGGLADTAVGVQAQESRTLGENNMVAQASAVRVDEPLGHFRRAIRHVMDLRHAIWIDTLEDGGRGIEAPAEVMSRLEAAGQSLESGRFTADKLKGRFRFKPYGSVDTADVGMRMQYFNQGLIALGNLAKMFPSIGPAVFGNPEVTMRVLQEWARVYKVRDVNVFLKAMTTGAAQGLPMPQGAGGALGPGAMPSGEPGAAGGPGPGSEMQALMQMLGGGGVN